MVPNDTPGTDLGLITSQCYIRQDLLCGPRIYLDDVDGNVHHPYGIR